jgi:acyl-coenzyme A thioesterase PaaI-like protein
MHDSARNTEYGVTPTQVMASMAGTDFVRAIFERRLPEPPIMQSVEPFDCTVEPGVVAIHSIPGFRHYNPIGSVHGGYAAILMDSAMGLAVHSSGGSRRRPFNNQLSSINFKRSGSVLQTSRGVSCGQSCTFLRIRDPGVGAR